MMHNILKTILEISIYSSAMIIAVLALGKLFSGKISAKVMHILWLLVLLRLLLPVTFQSPVNVPYPAFVSESLQAAPEDEPAQPDLTDAFFAESAENESSSYNFAENTTESEAAGTPSFKPDIKDVFVLLWLSGAAIFIAVSLYKIINYSRKIRNIKTANPIYGARLEMAKSALGIKKKIRIATSKYADIPLVCGVIRPVMLFPEGFAKTIGSKKLSYIIMHELCHVKRRDLLVNHIWLLARSLHWFNPLVHIAYKSYLDTVEEACDEMVLKCLENHDRYEYTQSLLDVARLANGSRKPALSVSLFGSGTSIRKRVMKMMHSNKKSKTFTVITALIACVMCFACFTTACLPNDEVKESEAVSPPTERGFNRPEEPENMRFEEGIKLIENLGLTPGATFTYSGYNEYFGDEEAIYNYYPTNESNGITYTIFSSDKSLASYHNRDGDLSCKTDLSENELTSIAVDYVKSIWDAQNVYVTSFEESYGRTTAVSSGYTIKKKQTDINAVTYHNYYLYNIRGIMGENNRPFYVTLSGEGELHYISSYPTNVDFEKGYTLEKANEKALMLIKNEVHLEDKKNITLVSSTLNNRFSLVYVLRYEYRSDNPSPADFDYDCEIHLHATNGNRILLSVTPITSNIDVIQPDEAAQMAKEYIAEKCYGSKDMWDRLTTTNMYTKVWDEEIGYSFFFDYHPKKESDVSTPFSHSIIMLANGEFWDIMSGPIDD